MSNFSKWFHTSVLLFFIIAFFGALGIFAQLARKNSGELSARSARPTVSLFDTPADLSGNYDGYVCIKDATTDRYELGGDWQGKAHLHIKGQSFWLTSLHHVTLGGSIQAFTQRGSNVGNIRITKVGRVKGSGEENLLEVNWDRELAMLWEKDERETWLAVAKGESRRFRFSITKLKPPCVLGPQRQRGR